MNIKPDPNHQEYLKALQRLGPGGRFQKAMELSQQAKELSLGELRKQFPDKTEKEIIQLYLKQLVLADEQTHRNLFC